MDPFGKGRDGVATVTWAFGLVNVTFGQLCLFRLEFARGADEEDIQSLVIQKFCDSHFSFTVKL